MTLTDYAEALIFFLAAFVVGAAMLDLFNYLKARRRRRRTRLLAEHPERLTDRECQRIAGGLQR